MVGRNGATSANAIAFRAAGEGLCTSPVSSIAPAAGPLQRLLSRLEGPKHQPAREPAARARSPAAPGGRDPAGLPDRGCAGRARTGARHGDARGRSPRRKPCRPREVQHVVIARRRRPCPPGTPPVGPSEEPSSTARTPCPPTRSSPQARPRASCFRANRPSPAPRRPTRVTGESPGGARPVHQQDRHRQIMRTTVDLRTTISARVLGGTRGQTPPARPSGFCETFCG